MVSLSKNNKRTSLHKKYKVAKKVRQHHKKEKKAQRNVKPKKELPLAMQIPMDYPLKNEYIQAAEQLDRMEKEKEKNRLATLRLLKIQGPAKIKAKKTKVVKKDDFNQLLEQSDIIIEVLDARDPMGTRCAESEKLIKAANKTLIFVLNKIDLVPLDNMKAWLACLSKEAKTFPMMSKRETAVAKPVKRAANKVVPVQSTRAPCGADNLKSYLESLNKDNVAKKIVVGVAGLTNTGKSSVINSMTRKSQCESNSEVETTKKIQRVALNSHVFLLDSPAIVVSEERSRECLLRNCVRVLSVEECASYGQVVYEMCPKTLLMDVYTMCQPDMDTYDTFLAAFSRDMVPLKKGGVSNMRHGALKLVHDWNSGKIAHCTDVPVCDGQQDLTAASVETGLSASDEAMLARNFSDVPVVRLSCTQSLVPTAPVDIQDGAEEEEDTDDEEEDTCDSDVQMAE